MLQRLNGWQRLWFVIAILALPYAVWFSLNEAANAGFFQHEVYQGFDKPECKAVVEMPAGQKLEPEPGSESQCWELYLYRSVYADAGSSSQAYIDHTNFLQRSKALEIFGLTFVVWIVSVGLLYLAGKIVGWVFCGFFPKPSP
jgi:uncharacterized membrane protein YbhN (UPF0104 family)